MTRCFAGEATDFEANYGKLQKDFPGLYTDDKGQAAEWAKWFDSDLAKKDVGATLKEFSTKYEDSARVGLPALDEAAITGAKGKIVGGTTIDFDQMEDTISLAESYLGDILKLHTDPDGKDVPEAVVNDLFRVATERSNFAQTFVNNVPDARDMGDTLPVTRRDVDNLFAGRSPAPFQTNEDWTKDDAKAAQDYVKKADTDFYKFIEQRLDEGSAGASDKEAEGLMKDIEAYFKQREGAQKLYNDGMTEVFDSQDISHYNWNKYAKSLFSCALWESKQKVAQIEDEIARLDSFIQSSIDLTPEIVRRMYEQNPTLHRSKNLQPQTFDPLFTPKLVLALRDAVDKEQLSNATKSFYLKQAQDLTAQGKKELDAFKKDHPKQSTTIKEFEGMDALYYEHMQARGDPIDKKIAESKGQYDRIVGVLSEAGKTVAQLADNVLRTKLWIVPGDSREAAVKDLTAKLVEYAKGKLDLAALDKAVQHALPAGIQGTGLDNAEGNDAEDLQVLCAFHETRITSPDLLGFTALVNEWPLKQRRAPHNVLQKMRLAREYLENQGFDNLVINVVVSMVEDRKPMHIPRLIQDYLEISKKYRGEVHGVIASATELSQPEYDAILKVLREKNPGKNFFLEKKVDKGLLGGFTVQAGVQRLDFSLASEIENFRRTM